MQVGWLQKCNLSFILLSTRPSLPAHSLITCCFGWLHSAVPQCHNEAACSFPNPILSHPRHSEIYIKPHNKECVQPAWPCYWQTYNGDRDLFLGSAVCLRDCTWSNGWERERSCEGEWCNGIDPTPQLTHYITSVLWSIRFVFNKTNILLHRKHFLLVFHWRAEGQIFPHL